MFLLGQTKPDYIFLTKEHGIRDIEELKASTSEMLKTVDLNIKKRDFEHILFNKRNSEPILSFNEFFQELK